MSKNWQLDSMHAHIVLSLAIDLPLSCPAYPFASLQSFLTSLKHVIGLHTSLEKRQASQMSANAPTSQDGDDQIRSRSTAEARDKNSHNEDLPAGWQKLVDEQGQVYYADHTSRTTTWDRPKPRKGQLPPGWEMARNEEGVGYFLDHNTHTTTLEDPRPE